MASENRGENTMDKKELKALRRPFVKELFRKNKFNLFMTVLAAVLTAVAGLVVSG